MLIVPSSETVTLQVSAYDLFTSGVAVIVASPTPTAVISPKFISPETVTTSGLLDVQTNGSELWDTTWNLSNKLTFKSFLKDF